MNKGTQAQSSDELGEAPTTMNNSTKNTVKNNILNSYLFKENTKKETVTPNLLGEDTSAKKLKIGGSVTIKNIGKAKEQKMEDEKFMQVKKEREHKRTYLSTLSTRFNPDLLTGGTNSSFIRGNEYFSKTDKGGKKT